MLTEDKDKKKICIPDDIGKLFNAQMRKTVLDILEKSQWRILLH